MENQSKLTITTDMYTQAVLKNIEREIRTHGYLCDHGGSVFYELPRGECVIEVQACDFGNGKEVWINKVLVGIIQ